MSIGIRSVPVRYSGVLFRSTLEADWAKVMDRLAMTWQYEPEAVQLPSGEYYRPDFFLPAQRIWLEVKGPHNDRIHKPKELAEALQLHQGWIHDLVVVGRAPTNGYTTFERADGAPGDLYLILCDRCGNYSFFDGMYVWCCRVCGSVGKVHAISRRVYGSGELPWVLS